MLETILGLGIAAVVLLIVNFIALLKMARELRRNADAIADVYTLYESAVEQGRRDRDRAARLTALLKDLGVSPETIQRHAADPDDPATPLR